MAQLQAYEWLTDSKLRDLDFADDIALLDESIKGMQDLTSEVEEAAKLLCLHVNAEKKMMIMGTWPDGNITVSGNTVENVNEFCYLGSIIQDDSSCDKDIRARLGKANGVFGRLTKIWRDKWSQYTHKDQVIRSIGFINTTVWSRDVVHECNQHKEA